MEKRKLPKSGVMITKSFLWFKMEIELPDCEEGSEFYKTIWTLKGKKLKEYVDKVMAMSEEDRYKLCSSGEKFE